MTLGQLYDCLDNNEAIAHDVNEVNLKNIDK